MVLHEFTSPVIYTSSVAVQTGKCRDWLSWIGYVYVCVCVCIGSDDIMVGVGSLLILPLAWSIICCSHVHGAEPLSCFPPCRFFLFWVTVFSKYCYYHGAKSFICLLLSLASFSSLLVTHINSKSQCLRQLDDALWVD